MAHYSQLCVSGGSVVWNTWERRTGKDDDKRRILKTKEGSVKLCLQELIETDLKKQVQN